MIMHLIIFVAVFAALAVAATWTIFFRMVREGLKMGEIRERD